MSLQKKDKITGQDQKLPIEEEKHSWTLESPKITMTRIKNLGVLIATSINIWQRIARSQRN